MREKEHDYVRRHFDLEEVLEMSDKHDIQILREEDYLYHAYIDKHAFGTASTPMFALVAGIKMFKSL
jgi:hypothetical protein